MQQKDRKSKLKKEAQTTETADEMIELMKSTKINDIPPKLALLWERQMTQISNKSSKGYRWNPRFLYNTCMQN